MSEPDVVPAVAAVVAAPEDVVLSKLRWFRQTGGTSERQWLDVLGVLRLQGASLDHAYLRRWAGDLGLTELPERAPSEASGQ